MLCEAVLLATILDKSVKRNEHCYVYVKVQAPVVQKVDSAIHWINLCPVDIAIALCNHLSRHWIVHYLLDSAIQRLNNLGQLDHF